MNLKDSFFSVREKTRNIYLSKNKKYGDSWKSLRLSSIADIVFIKLQRIKNILVHNTQSVTR